MRDHFEHYTSESVFCDSQKFANAEMNASVCTGSGKGNKGIFLISGNERWYFHQDHNDFIELVKSILVYKKEFLREISNKSLQ